MFKFRIAWRYNDDKRVHYAYERGYTPIQAVIKFSACPKREVVLSVERV